MNILIILTSPDDTPLIIVSRELAEVEAVLELMIVEVPTDPPTLEVSVLAEELRMLDVFKLVTDKFVLVPLVITALVTVALPNIGLSVNMYVTCPPVVVATVRLLLVEEARKLYSDEADVVAVTPLTVEVNTPFNAVRVLELTIEEVEVTPFTTDVRVLTAEIREF